MKKFILGLVLLTGFKVWGHGEDKPGPHGGFVSMPGPFHVEVVPEGKQKLKVYLLDMHWRNPTLENSSLSLRNGKTPVPCRPDTDHFVCNFISPMDITKPGKISVTATRAQQKGNVIDYALPLKLKKEH